MYRAFDCSRPLSYDEAKAFYDNGYTHVIRYLVPDGYSKHLSKKEAEDICRAGLRIISVFEIRGSCEEMTADCGKKHGELALQCAKDVGQPINSGIYFAMDFEATAADMPNIRTYITACAKEIPGYSIGAYGSFDVVEYLADCKVCDLLWQTYAWSYGKISKRINLYQNKNGILVNGIEIDLDVDYGNDGSWTLMTVNFDQTAANKVDGVLSALYNATNDVAVKNAAHYAANALREATRQPIQKP